MTTALCWQAQHMDAWRPEVVHVATVAPTVPAESSQKFSPASEVLAFAHLDVTVELTGGKRVKKAPELPLSEKYWPMLKSASARGVLFAKRMGFVVELTAEMIALRDRFGVRDFQVEDLNPTVKGSRWLEICEKLVARDAGVRFYFVSGTKAETVKPEHVPLYARAGCRYISISPESGSRDVMKAIGKPFDYAHGEALVSACHDAGIYTQACFLVGHPAETIADFEMSVAYLKRLVRGGLDEVAVFVVAPLAGSRLHRDKTIPIASESSLVSFSPRGRLDWVEVSRRRHVLIRAFF
jgi:hypothetical protein